MPALLDHIDPNGLEEFSVVFTDRSLNHMSKNFRTGDLSSIERGLQRTCSCFGAWWRNICYGSCCASIWY